MKLNRTVIIVGVLTSALLVGCHSSSGVVSTGAETFMIARTGHGSGGRVKASAMAEATAFCERQGKVLQVVDSSERDGLPGFTDSRAEIHFRCLDPNDPRLREAVAAAKPERAAEPPPPAPISRDDLYTQLTKLNQLRKQGILTEEEFQAQKKRLLGTVD